MFNTPLTNFVNSLSSTHQLQRLCLQAKVQDPKQTYQVYKALYAFHLNQWNTYVTKMVNFCASEIMHLEEVISNMKQQNQKLKQFSDSVVEFFNLTRLEVEHEELYNFLLSHQIWNMEVHFELTMFSTMSAENVRQYLLGAVLNATNKLHRKLMFLLEQKKNLGLMMLDIEYCKREVDITIQIFHSDKFSKEQIKSLKKIHKKKIYRSAFRRCTKLMKLK